MKQNGHRFLRAERVRSTTLWRTCLRNTKCWQVAGANKIIIRLRRRLLCSYTRVLASGWLNLLCWCRAGWPWIIGFSVFSFSENLKETETGNIEALKYLRKISICLKVAPNGLMLIFFDNFLWTMTKFVPFSLIFGTLRDKAVFRRRWSNISYSYIAYISVENGTRPIHCYFNSKTSKSKQTWVT